MHYTKKEVKLCLATLLGVLLFAILFFSAKATITSITLTSPENNSWTNDSTPDFTFTAISDIDDNFTCELFIDGSGYGVENVTNGTATTITANNSLSDGSHNWFINCTDVNGTTKSETRIINVDTVPPSTTASAVKSDGSTYTFNTWTNSPYVNVTLTCSDSDSGCNVTLYCLDSTNACDPNITYTGIIQINTEGTTYIRYRSNDTAGNLENISNQTIRIDTIAPSIAFGTGTTSGNYSQNYIEVNVTASDSGSGINTISVYLYNDTQLLFVNTSGSSPFVLNYTSLQDGTYYLNATVNDTAGNYNSTETRTILLDTTPPTTTASAVDDSGNSYTFDTWVNTSYINVTLNASDNVAGVDTTLFCTDNTDSCDPNQTYTGTIQISNEGTTYVKFKSNDTVGNDEAISSVAIKIDRTKPTITYVQPTPDSGTITNQDLVINVTASDTFSGISQIQIWVNNTNIYNCSSSPCNYTLTADGNYTFYAIAIDNVSWTNQTTPRNVVVDKTAPQFYEYIKAQNLTGSSATVYINATDVLSGLAANVTVTINGTAYNMSLSSGNMLSGVWQYTFDTTPFNDGLLTITFNATDKATNPNTTTINVTIDNNPPFDVEFISPDPNKAKEYSGSINVKVFITDCNNAGCGSGIKQAVVFVNKSSNVNCTLSLVSGEGDIQTGNWSCNLDISSLVDKSYILVVNATDWVNLSNANEIAEIIVNNDLLKLSATSDDEPAYFDQHPNITFRANYTHLGQVINDSVGSCYINISKLNVTNAPMSFNTSTKLYEYTYINVSQPGTIDYTVYCNNTAGYTNETTQAKTFIIYNASISGFVYNFSNPSQAISNALVKVEELCPPEVTDCWSYSTTTNSSGGYIIIFNDTSPTEYFIHIIYPATGKALLTSPILPPMRPPFLEPGQTQANLTGMNFYLVDAATINITNVTKDEKQIKFSGELFKGTMPLTFFQNVNPPYAIVVPANKDYSLNIYKIPQNSSDDWALPHSKTISASNLTPGNVYNISFNLTTQKINVQGYLLPPSGSGNVNFTDLQVYIYISSFVPSLATIEFPDNPVNSTTGFYNITLPSGSSYVIAGFANNGTHYFVGYTSLTNLNTNTTKNITLYNALGTLVQATKFNEVTTKKIKFNFTDEQNHSITDVFMQANITYPDGSSILWMLEGAGESVLAWPIPQGSSVKAEVFSPRAPPRKYSWDASYLASNPVVHIQLSDFKVSNPENDVLSNVNITFLRNSTACNGPYYNSSCVILSSNATGFDPFKAMFASTATIRLEQQNGVIVEFVGVDLVNSGPPDAQYDTSASESTSGGTFEAVWKLGSLAPDVYDYILASVKYDPTKLNESGTIKIKIKQLYWDNWSVRWTESDGYSAVPSEYSDYNPAYLNGTGVVCVKDNLTGFVWNASGVCFVNTTENRVWFTLPHFSGAGPAIVGSAIVTAEEETTAGGGAGGGAAVTAGEKKKHCWASIDANQWVEVNVSNKIIGIETVKFMVEQALSSVCFEARQLTDEDLTTEIEKQNAEMPNLTVYKSFSLRLSKGVVSKAIITFSLNKTWLNDWMNANNFSNFTVYLERLSNGKWYKYETTKSAEDNDFIYYKANVPGFSVFAITLQGFKAEKPIAKPVCGNGVCEANETQENCCLDCGCPVGKECINNVCVEKPKKKLGWIVWVIIAVVVVLIIIVISIARKKK